MFVCCFFFLLPLLEILFILMLGINMHICNVFTFSKALKYFYLRLHSQVCSMLLSYHPSTSISSPDNQFELLLLLIIHTLWVKQAFIIIRLFNFASETLFLSTSRDCFILLNIKLCKCDWTQLLQLQLLHTIYATIIFNILHNH